MDEQTNKSIVLPPGSHPCDPYKSEIDAVAFALDRLHAHLNWITEHHSGLLAARGTDNEVADRELAYLGQSTEEATKHVARLIELLLAGYAIDPNKNMPDDLERLRQTLDI